MFGELSAAQNPFDGFDDQGNALVGTGEECALYCLPGFTPGSHTGYATSATDGGSLEISSTQTPGVLYIAGLLYPRGSVISLTTSVTQSNSSASSPVPICTVVVFL